MQVLILNQSKFYRIILLWEQVISFRGSLPQPFRKQQILDYSKLKEFADDNFRFDEKSRKLSKLVENTEGEGEIARYEQFLLFPQCFQKTCTAVT